MAQEPVDILQIDYYDEQDISPVQGNTPFGYFEDDPEFQNDAPKITKRIARNLGYPVNDLEVTDENIYSNIENALMDFSQIMNEFKISEDYFSLIGKDKNNVDSNTLIYPNLNYFLRIASSYATETGIGGDVPYHYGSISLQKGKQMYDLKEEYFNTEHPNEKGFTIREVYHYRRPAQLIGTTAGNFVGLDSVDKLIGQFGFGGGSYNRYYTLMPLSWDVQRMQSVKMARQIRESHYGFQLEGQQLRIFPIPEIDFTVHFKYTLASEEQGENSLNELYSDNSGDIINDPTKVDFGYFQWSELPPRDRTWIISYAEAKTKITLGENRRKFSSLQYPNGDISLNGDALVSEGKEEVRELKENMRQYLEKLSKERSLDIEQQKSQALNEKLRRIPLGLYRV